MRLATFEEKKTDAAYYDIALWEVLNPDLNYGRYWIRILIMGGILNTDPNYERSLGYRTEL